MAKMIGKEMARASVQKYETSSFFLSLQLHKEIILIILKKNERAWNMISDGNSDTGKYSINF